MKGEVVFMYAFDVANEIATERVEDILAEKPFALEIRADQPVPRDVPMYRPLEIELPALATTLRGQKVRIVVRVYEVGVVSITCRARLDASLLDELVEYHHARLDDGKSLDNVAQSLCGKVVSSIADALVQSSPASEPEAYIAFCLTEVGEHADVEQWLAANRRAVAELLAEASPGKLSESQVSEILRIQRSYSKSDCVVIDWDAALIVDLDGYMDDVLYVLELANLQLEEYRTMDRRLDRYLDRVYDDVKRLSISLSGSRLTTLRTLRLFRVDATKLNDEVTHISKFVGDWYLARVYLGAVERFYLNQWRRSIEDRLGQLDQLYTVVNSDVNNRRMFLLEVLIVIFFAIDLLLVAFK